VEQTAARYNLESDELQREHQGSSARRVFCIHCQSSQDGVTTNIVRCRGCGRHLVVRDHYSRRLAAFMGVMADAEAPGRLPEIREVFA
jgi:dimethylamine monooxygenase subunit C